MGKQVEVIWARVAWRVMWRVSCGPGAGWTWNLLSQLLILGANVTPQRPGGRLFSPADRVASLVVLQGLHHNCSNEMEPFFLLAKTVPGADWYTWCFGSAWLTFIEN